MKSFFTFRRFISPALIVIIFWLGAVFLFLLWLYKQLSIPHHSWGYLKSVVGLFFLLALWRIICERFVVHFRVYETIDSMKRYLDKDL